MVMIFDYAKLNIYISLLFLYIRNWFIFSYNSIIQIKSIYVIEEKDKNKAKNYYDNFKIYNKTLNYHLWRFFYIFTWFLNKKYYKIRIKTTDNSYKILTNADFNDVFIFTLKHKNKSHIKPLIKFKLMNIDITKDILPYTYYDNKYEDFILFNSRDGILRKINNKYKAYIHTNTFTYNTDNFIEYQIIGKPKRIYLMKNVIKHLDNHIPLLNDL